jgi:hypothetical protein
MPLELGLTFWKKKTTCEGTHFYDINKAMVFEIIPQFDSCYLCKGICIVDAEITLGKQKRRIEGFRIFCLWENK